MDGREGAVTTAMLTSSGSWFLALALAATGGPASHPESSNWGANIETVVSKIDARRARVKKASRRPGLSANFEFGKAERDGPACAGLTASIYGDRLTACYGAIFSNPTPEPADSVKYLIFFLRHGGTIELGEPPDGASLVGLISLDYLPYSSLSGRDLRENVVEELQAVLVREKLLAGPADGKFGPKTLHALKVYAARK